MIYAVFLCMTFAGRPDLDECDPYENLVFETKAECLATITQMHAFFRQPGKHPIDDDFDLGPLHGHRELRCGAHQTWTEVR